MVSSWSLRFFAVLAVASLLLSTPVSGQFTKVLNIPTQDPNIGDNQSIESDTQLNLFNGGSIGNQFMAGAADGSSSNIEVNILGGKLGDNFNANNGSIVNFFNGRANRLAANDGSFVNVSGGFMHGLTAGSRSTLNITGGLLRSFGVRNSGGHAQISGGAIQLFSSVAGSSADLFGGEFRLNGVPITGLDAIGDQATLGTLNEFLLTGTLADGTPFVFSDETNFRFRDAIADGTLTLNVVDVPPIDRTIFNVPGDPTPHGLRAGQTLIVSAGATLGNYLLAAPGSVVEVSGGSIHDNFESVGAEVTVTDGLIRTGYSASAGSTVHLLGGSIGESFGLHNSTLNIAGGVISSTRSNDPANFFAKGSVINMSQGSIGPVASISDSTLNISGGWVGNRLTVTDGSILNVTGGTVGSLARVIDGSTANISGGTLNDLSVDGNSTLNVAGGLLGANTQIVSDSEVHISGGRFGLAYDRVRLRSESGFRIDASSVGTISGGDFRLNGVPIAGLEQIGDSLVLHQGSNPYVLSGTLADGTPFFFSNQVLDEIADGVLTLNTVALPAVGPSVIRLPVDPAPQSLRDGQRLIIEAGGQVEDNFSAGHGSAIELRGGRIGGNLRAVGTDITVVDGTIGQGAVLFDGTTLNLGGEVVLESSIVAQLGSQVNVSGEVQGSVGARFGSEVNVMEGAVLESPSLFSFVDSVTAFSGAVANISGGRLNSFGVQSGGVANVSGGAFFSAKATGQFSRVNLSGGEFRLDGVLLEGQETVGTTLIPQLPDDSLLSGVFADGTPFILDTFWLSNGDIRLRVTDLPAIGPTTLRVPDDPAPLGIRSGQTMVVADGGTVGAHFRAGRGSKLEVTGGTVGRDLRAINAQVDVIDGEIGDSFTAYYGTTVNVSGGRIGESFRVYQQSEVNISGGEIGDDFEVTGEGIANIRGGQFGSVAIDLESTAIVSGGQIASLRLTDGSTLDMSGGEIGFLDAGIANVFIANVVNVSGGTVDMIDDNFFGTLNISGGSVGVPSPFMFSRPVNVFGSHFVINGVDITDSLIPGVAKEFDLPLRSELLLEAVLSDGSPFEARLIRANLSPTLTVTITLVVPEPSVASLLVVCLVVVSVVPQRVAANVRGRVC